MYLYIKCIQVERALLQERSTRQDDARRGRGEVDIAIDRDDVVHLSIRRVQVLLQLGDGVCALARRLH